jgi:TnpA family transposase
MDPDQSARMRRLVWINAGRKRTMLVLTWRGSNDYIVFLYLFNSKKNVCCKLLTLLNFIISRKSNQNIIFFHLIGMNCINNPWY